MADPASAALTHHDLEDLIEARGRELLRLLLQAHLGLRERAEREQGERAGRPAVRGADGQVRPHHEVGHCRRLACVFGTVSVTRTAWRGRSMTSVRPLDADLSLPAGLHSHGLRRRAVAEAVRGSYDQAKEAIELRCGKGLGKRQAAYLVACAAVDIDGFYARRVPAPSTAPTTLVIQVDGKGIAMRPSGLRPATLKAHLKTPRAMRTRLAPGEKPPRKRMATNGWPRWPACSTPTPPRGARTTSSPRRRAAAASGLRARDGNRGRSG